MARIQTPTTTIKKNYEINFDSDLIQARFPPDTVNNTKRHLLHMFHRTQATLR